MSDSDRPPLITVAELAASLQTPALLVVDCRHDLLKPDWGRHEYAAGHVPGAVLADLDTALSGPRYQGSGRHPLPSPAAFAATLGSWGFTAASQVVVYDQGNGAIAARLWWLLRSRGHTQVRLLDGGYAAWCAAGLPCSTAVPQPTRTVVAAREFAGMLETAEVVQALHAGTIRLIDARAADRYAGQNETIDPVAGHVPGALNHPFGRNLGADARYLETPELQRRWGATLAGTPSKDVVAMCGSGVTACHNLLALELAGLPGARLYAGSFSEWIADRSRPVAVGSEP